MAEPIPLPRTPAPQDTASPSASGTMAPQASPDAGRGRLNAAFDDAASRTPAMQAMAVLGQIPRLVLRAPILLYRYTLSSFMGRQCRYLPTCSEYADEAIARHGAWSGAWMATARLCRCHPWGGAGFDPVPEVRPARGRWFAPWRYGIWRMQETPKADPLSTLSDDDPAGDGTPPPRRPPAG